MNTIEDLLSPEARRALKERFGNKWRKAWVAWQKKPSGTWMVTKVEWLTANDGVPENSGDMFCLGLRKPTMSDLQALHAQPGTIPAPSYTAKEIIDAFAAYKAFKERTLQ